MRLPETLIGTAFGLVAFPTLAELAARGDLAGLRRTLSQSLRVVVALTVPAAVGLIVLGRPLLQLLYQRGAFDANSTEAVYVALRFYTSWGWWVTPAWSWSHVRFSPARTPSRPCCWQQPPRWSTSS